MDITIRPGKLTGSIPAIPSKSQVHRLLICAAFADASTALLCPETNQDIEATADCLAKLGATVERSGQGYRVCPVKEIPKNAELDCRESGSTLRFLLPIVGALGVDALFHMSGRLPERPLSPLWELMERMGCRLSRPTSNTLRCSGQLIPGVYSIAGNVSSQFITGLLYALSLMEGESRIEITGDLESAPYVAMTQDAMALFGVDVSCLSSCGRKLFQSPGTLTVEGDWSNAAFWLAANALGSRIEITGLHRDSRQGDRAVEAFLQMLENNVTIDARSTPDLIPVLAIVAGAKNGATFCNCGRLRLKETDRLQTTAAMIAALGGSAEICGDTLTVHATGYRGGVVDATNDHRIAMSAAVAATVCQAPVTVLNAQAVQKSYPAFWRDYEMLGGTI